MTSFHAFESPESTTYPVTPLACTSITQEGDTLRIAFAGDLDADTADRFVHAVTQAMDAMPLPRLQIDLAGIDFISAAGLRALLTCHRRAAGQQRLLTIRDPQPAVRHVLRVAEIPCPSEDEPQAAQDSGYHRRG
ncbi:anti-anti-sigma factor [Catenuloplanes nepalensis]|uniref:Anti-anti-sigma factor n=1 Tax=Catenuloplanes nepalensis TaxID=587533 RepID=A0ABT9N6W8_9ACTN|nr:STAS domain-containing protein [Catenuloplanes nepalensis]MDP9799429.1 anti-anti-sigma factor [Catenuloplanes nepalensis]